MGALVVEIVLGLLVVTAAFYGAARCRAAERHAKASREDVQRVLGSLEHAHGSLEVLAMMMEAQRRQLERMEWLETPRPVNDNSRSRATASRSDGEASTRPSTSRPSAPPE